MSIVPATQPVSQVVAKPPPWANTSACPGNLSNLGAFVQMMRKFAEAGNTVPSGVDIQRLSAACVTAARKVPALLNCTYLSWAKAISDAYTWGLDPLKREVWFIPFASDVQCIIGYQGLLALARRHPDFIDIEADCVPMEDWERGLVEITLVPWSLKRALGLRNDDSGGWALAYCHVVFKVNGTMVVKGHVLQWHEIVKRAEQSKNCIWSQEEMRFVGKTGRNGEEKVSPWTLWTREMARKSVLAAFLRSGQVPMSAEALQALDREDELQTKLAEQEARTLSNNRAAETLLLEESSEPTPDFKGETEKLANKAPVPVGASLEDLLEQRSDQAIMDAFEEVGIPVGVPVGELNSRERDRLLAALGGAR